MSSPSITPAVPMPHAVPAATILVVESSVTRQHVLRRVLAGRFPEIVPCRTSAAALELLNGTDPAARPGAVLLGLEAAPQPHTRELLAQLRDTSCEDLAVLILAHNAEPPIVEWVSQRARSAILLWNDFTDSAECLAKLLAPAREGNDAEAAVPAEPIRVLFVDDSRTVRVSYARLLAERGYTVEIAAGAGEALEKARTQAFDIAIIDYFMPGENGDALCRRLHADPRTAGITAAILTGAYHDQVIQDSLKAGAVECMFKNEAQELFLARLDAMARMVRAQKSVEAERSRLSGILSSVGDGVYGVDREGFLTFMNPAARAVLGIGETEPLAGVRAHERFHARHEDGGANALSSCRLQSAYAGGGELRGWETVFWRQDTAVPVECTVFPLHVEGRLEGSVVAFRDVSERRALEQELLWQANHDPLTKLYNRRYFEAQLAEEAERCRRGDTSALLYIDLDRFKYINDTAGHAAGDQLLAELSLQMRERLRGADLLARLGGDEFAIILRHVREDQVLGVAEQFRDVLERHTFVYGGQPYRIYGSVGVALIDAHTATAGEVLANADIACHVAKSSGRNQTHVYRPESDARQAMHVELGWSARLQQALKTDRFVLHYHPIVPLRDLDVAALPAEGQAFPLACGGGMHDEGVLHCEALVRLRDEHGGVIAPNAFLPTAERFGLMPHIDLWVIRCAIEQLAELNRRGVRTCIAVNLSGHTLDHERLVPEVLGLLAAHEVDPRALIFEITETNAIANIEAAQRLIAGLRQRGCRFALDDFGSGFSSFHHLKHLPVDFVKIDGQFVRDMARDPADRAIVESINDIAHSFGKRTVAEFVENLEILRMLKACGVDYAQGYYISPPRSDAAGFQSRA